MTIQWVADAHGSLNLFPAVDGEEGHVWVMPRRAYCDRGHWDWGYTGLAWGGRARMPEPSYYFLRLNTAIAEIESWVVSRLSGSAAAVANTLAAHVGGFDQPQGRGAGWAWRLDSDRRLVADAGDARAVLTWNADAPNGVVLTVDGVDSLDDSDRFPRLYGSVARAIQETEDFLAWRLLKVPAEVPAPIVRPPQPVSDALAKALTQAAIDRPFPPQRSHRRHRPC